jgi:hypothetical protein
MAAFWRFPLPAVLNPQDMIPKNLMAETRTWDNDPDAL